MRSIYFHSVHQDDSYEATTDPDPDPLPPIRFYVYIPTMAVLAALAMIFCTGFTILCYKQYVYMDNIHIKYL